MVNSGVKEWQTPTFKSLIDQAYKTLDRLKEKRILSNIYTWNQYGDDSTILSKTDKTTGAIYLPYRIFTFNNYNLRIALGKFSMADLKYLAGHITIAGENALKACVYGIGQYKLKDMISKLIFYEQQVMRVYKESENDKDNLFLLNRDRKIGLITNQLTDILNYLYSYDDFVFGKISGSWRKSLYNRALEYQRNNGQREFDTRYPGIGEVDELVKMLANYTTINEAKEGIVECGAARRFILSKAPKKQ